MQKLLKPHEIADLLGVKPSTIYQWTHEGYIPHIKVGRNVRFRECDIEQWLDKKNNEGRINRRVDVSGMLI